MGNVDISHKEIAVADHGNAVILNGPCGDRHVFTNHVVIANHQTRIFAFVLFILGLAADTGIGENAVAFPDFCISRDIDMGNQYRTRTDLHLRSDNAKRSDNNVIGQLSGRID